jgi:hypothetical protein
MSNRNPRIFMCLAFVVVGLFTSGLALAAARKPSIESMLDKVAKTGAKDGSLELPKSRILISGRPHAFALHYTQTSFPVDPSGRLGTGRISSGTLKGKPGVARSDHRKLAQRLLLEYGPRPFDRSVEARSRRTVSRAHYVRGASGYGEIVVQSDTQFALNRQGGVSAVPPMR